MRLLAYPEFVFPTTGETYRFVYRVKGPDAVKSGWPQAVAQWVDQSSDWEMLAWTYSPSVEGIVVDVKKLSSPLTSIRAITLEDSVSILRRFSFTQNTVAELTALFSVFTTEVYGGAGDASRFTAAANTLDSVFSQPPPDDTDYSVPNNAVGDAANVFLDSVSDFFGFAGESASKLLGGVFTPSVALVVVGVAVIYVMNIRRGR